jgi:hypothetical protein
LYNGTINVPENINLLDEMFDYFYMVELDMIDILHLLNKFNTFKTPQQVSFLFNVYFKHSKKDYKQEINDFWITFYDSLLKYVKSEKNIEIYFNLLENVNVYDEKFFKEIHSLIIDCKNEENYSQMIELYFKLYLKLRMNDEKIQEKNEKLQVENHDLQNKLNKKNFE